MPKRYNFIEPRPDIHRKLHRFLREKRSLPKRLTRHLLRDLRLRDTAEHRRYLRHALSVDHSTHRASHNRRAA